MPKYLIFSTLLLSLLLTAAYQPIQKSTPTADAIQQEYHRGLSAFNSELIAFRQYLGAEKPDSIQCIQAFRRVRTAYKNIEFLFAFLDPDNAKGFVNGPPLPSLNTYLPLVEVIAPSGMQPIEELLYGGNFSADLKELLHLTDGLIEAFKPIYHSNKKIQITDREILEAIRSGIFRITTLGLTGFDTPGSGDAIVECAQGLEAMQATAKFYYPYLPAANRGLADSLERAFAGASDFMRKNPDFNTFDRIYCIRQYLEPLYGMTLRFHSALGVETVYEVLDNIIPTRYLSPHMFSEKTLNDHYYAEIGAETESKTVIALGKALFFDPILSNNNKRSCASCHKPELAFTDGQAKSLATDFNGTVARNAPTLINSVFADRFFYDLRASGLEGQAEHVIFEPKEFNTNFFEILDKISQSQEYLDMFRAAYNQKPSAQNLSRALTAYVRTLKSFNSPVDRYLRGENIVLNKKVQQGFNLFMGKALCGTCHFAPTYAGLVPPVFKESESEVIGVPLDPKAKKLEIDPDKGRYFNRRPRENAPHFIYSFKTTTVRNSKLTAPYMHNGVYQKLEEVVDFYNKGGGAGLGLDLPNQTLPFDNLQLTPDEQKALVSFMEALTDTAGLTSKPSRLPAFENHPEWNKRAIGGEY